MTLLCAVENGNDFAVKDLSLAKWGRIEIEMAEIEMPGLMALRDEYKGKKPLHMTIQTAVLIETLWSWAPTCAGRPATSSPPRTTPPRPSPERQGPVFAYKGETLASTGVHAEAI